MPTMKEVKRKYNFADSWLITLCNRIIVCVLRDIAEFAGYGVTAPDVTAYTNEVNDFEDLPTDIELVADQAEKTKAKDLSVEAVKTLIRAIMARVVSVFSIGSVEHNGFGTKGLDAMTDSEILLCGRRVARRATKYILPLTPAGVTALMVTDLKNKCQAQEVAMEEQADAILDRDEATENRAILGNALYDRMMVLCGFGQSIWVETSEAKYNDYVIYTKSGGLVNPIEMNIAAGTTENIANKVFKESDTFDITNTGTVKLMFGLCVDASTPVTSGVGLSAGETKTATAAELGDFAANQFLNCTNSSVSDGSFKIKLP